MSVVQCRLVDGSNVCCQHVVSYSISQGTVVNVVALASDLAREGTVYDGPWVSPCSKEELLACYVGWEPEVKELLDVRAS